MKKTLVLIALLIPPAFAACIADGGPIVFDDGPVDSGAPDASPLPDAAPDAPQDAPSPLPDSGDAGGAASADSGTDAAPDASDGAPPACIHDKCAAGVALDPTCDPCVAAVCEVIPSCCNGGGDWEVNCIAVLENKCGGQSVCDTDTAPCAHDWCITGDPLVGGVDDACSIIVYDVCVNQEMPSCCTTAWDQACVDIASVSLGWPCPS